MLFFDDPRGRGEDAECCFALAGVRCHAQLEEDGQEVRPRLAVLRVLSRNLGDSIANLVPDGLVGL